MVDEVSSGIIQWIDLECFALKIGIGISEFPEQLTAAQVMSRGRQIGISCFQAHSRKKEGHTQRKEHKHTHTPQNAVSGTTLSRQSLFYCILLGINGKIYTCFMFSAGGGVNALCLIGDGREIPSRKWGYSCGISSCWNTVFRWVVISLHSGLSG